MLVDTGPDLRQQLLDNDIGRIDAVIWTHDHADHCHGIDDLRQLYLLSKTPIMGFASAVTSAALRARFGYVFEGNAGYPATATLNSLCDIQAIGPFMVRTVEQPHGPVLSTGLRFEADDKSAAYAIDFSDITREMMALYDGVDALISDCLREPPHPTHAHLAMTLNLFAATGAKMGWLTHMDKSMDYVALAASLPPHIRPAFDGMTVEV